MITLRNLCCKKVEFILASCECMARLLLLVWYTNMNLLCEHIRVNVQDQRKVSQAECIQHVVQMLIVECCLFQAWPIYPPRPFAGQDECCGLWRGQQETQKNRYQTSRSGPNVSENYSINPNICWGSSANTASKERGSRLISGSLRVNMNIIGTSNC
jgi:hypothetical protein